MTFLLRTYTVRSLRRRAFLRGAASAFDLSGQTYRQYRTGGDDDAARTDFAAVGADLRAALATYAGRR
jgi:hypothetical protein